MILTGLKKTIKNRFFRISVFITALLFTFLEMLLDGEVLMSTDTDFVDPIKDDFCDEFVMLVFILTSLSDT